MWKTGDTVSWRGIHGNRVWHVQPTVVVQDRPDELVLTLLPGTECMAEESYPKGKNHSRRWYDFRDQDWRLEKYVWRTNRFLLLLQPGRFYSTILFWNHASNEFLYYYINFQLPFQRSHYAVDTLDLELDLIIHPDFSYEWKDEEEYRKASDQGLISQEHVQCIEAEIPGILEKLVTRQYPFDGSWLDWIPDPGWSPARLPKNWDKI
jgi:hypothetical protein